MDTNLEEKQRKTERDPEEISRERNKGKQLNMDTGPEMDTSQTNIEVPGDGLVC